LAGPSWPCVDEGRGRISEFVEWLNYDVAADLQHHRLHRGILFVLVNRDSSGTQQPANGEFGPRCNLINRSNGCATRARDHWGIAPEIIRSDFPQTFA